MNKADLSELWAIVDWARASHAPDAMKVREMLGVFDKVRQRLETARLQPLAEGYTLAMFVSALKKLPFKQMRIDDENLLAMAYDNALRLVSIEEIEVDR